ncbi:MAG: hypothetical protein MJE77_34300 [Proteobacteria bacterium]|nr:hypothetical protein [Pseudomonadota bacterium]
MIKDGLPAVELRGYIVASAPAADPRHFLGRQYDAATGTLGGVPCPMSNINETASSQRLATNLSKRELVDFVQQHGTLLGFALDASKLEGVRIELKTTKKAMVMLWGRCRISIVHDAIAGYLYVEYSFKDNVDVRAEARQLESSRPDATYHYDEQRNVVSQTLRSDEYVAFRVQHPGSSVAWGIPLLIGGGVVFAAGGVLDINLSIDGMDNSKEWIPIAMYATSAALGLLGYWIQTR